MKNNFKILVLVVIGLMATSCTKEDDSLNTPTAKGTWYIDWVNDFVAQYPDVNRLTSLCDPGNTVTFNINGTAKTVWSGTPENGKTIPSSYLAFGARSGNSNTLYHTTHNLSCDDIAITSIEHREIYITGQPGYIKKQVGPNGECQLFSERARTRPKFTVFISVAGIGKRYVNGQEQTDENNRLSGVTVRCNDNGGGQVEEVYRSSNAVGNVVGISTKVNSTNGVIAGLRNKSSILSDEQIIDTKTNRELLNIK